MKKSILICLLISSYVSAAVNPNFWYSLAWFASSRLAERSSEILRKIDADSKPKETVLKDKLSEASKPSLSSFLSRYAAGAGFLSSAALLYYSLEEAQKIN
jgi:hypothetical protein